MKQNHWVFLSPHFDDAALSCGGLIWDLTNRGHRVEIWTVMAAYPPDQNYSAFAQKNHQAWGKSGHEAINMRREEDKRACEILGAVPRHLNFPDAIYRRHADAGIPVVNNNEELFSKAPENDLVKKLTAFVLTESPEDANLILPLGLGGHLDHRVVVEAGKQLPKINYYYADYPYILWSFEALEAIHQTYQRIPQYLSGHTLKAWQDAVLSYRSQLSSFWRDDEEARLALQNYQAGGGGRLWKKQ